MFSYLRIFLIVSVVFVVITAVLVGFYYRKVVADDIIMRQAERNNVSLAQGFINTVWRQNGSVVQALYEVESEKRASYEEFITFSKDSLRYFQGIPVVKFNIYTPYGERFYSTDQNEINITGASGEGDPTGGIMTARQVATSGKFVSEALTDTTFLAPGGVEKNGVLIRTLVPIISESYIPIMAGNNPPKVEAVIEVFYDVSEPWSGLFYFQSIGTFIIISIFGIFCAALIYTSRRAERIIERQYDTNLELAAAKARAETENQEKSKFLANISHELRTPLNAIIGFSEIIKDEVMGAMGNEQYKNYIRDIYSSGVHLLSLINDILDYSKAEAGKLVLEYEQVDVNKIVKTCMRLVSPRAENAAVNLHEDLPGEHMVITTDAKRLKQVLLNLLSNAVKFTPANGTVSIAGWLNVVENSLYLEVKDTGIGIAPKDIAKAMAPFGQVDSELSRKYEGTGLGLPLTKKFVELMGGTFSIHSEINVGTTITICLPKVLKKNQL